MKKLFLLLVLCLLTACQKEDVLVIGVDDTFAPMGFRENGELVGFDIDLAKAVSEEIGMDIKFQTIDWDMKEEELKQGNIDLIWNGYSVTENRKEKVLFSDSYLNNRQVICVLSDSSVNSKADLIGKKIALQKESSALEALKKDPLFDQVEVIEFDTNNEALLDLEFERADAVIADEVLVRYYMNLKGKDKFRLLEEDFGKEEYAIGLRKEDTELKAKIDEALKKLVDNGTYQKIYEEWL